MINMCDRNRERGRGAPHLVSDTEPSDTYPDAGLDGFLPEGASTHPRLHDYGRFMLTGPLDVYVSPEGDVSNNGFTPGTAFKTIRRALDSTFSLGKSPHPVTINLLPGEYDEERVPINFNRHYDSIRIHGDSPETTKINGYIACAQNGRLHLKGVAVESHSAYCTLAVTSGARAVLEDNVVLGNSVNCVALVLCEKNAQCLINNRCVLKTAKTPSHLLYARELGSIEIANAAIHAHNCNSSQYLCAESLGAIFIYAGTLFTGDNTGGKYCTRSGGTIVSNGVAIPGTDDNINTPATGFF